MKGLRPAGTVLLFLSLSLTNAVVNAKDPEYNSSVSASIQQTFTATARDEYPVVANRDSLSKLQRALAEYEYYASENDHGLQAPNRSHNLRTYFETSGIRVHDRTAVGSPKLASLSLSGMGHGEKIKPVPAGTVNHSEARVEIRRPDIVEWYENSTQGLEQGFTLQARMEGEGLLVLELTVEHAQASLRGQSIVLATDTGRRLHYGKLSAKDANGQLLKSHFEVSSPRHVRLVVEDSGATYPVVIDPLLTAVSDAFLESNQLGSSGIKPSAFGGSVAGAGDVNGDGFADVVVGAWGWDGGENEEGAAFVFLGSANGIVGSDPSTAYARIESNQAAARLGWSVSGAGDVNGDGFDDIVVGAYLYNSEVFFEGFGLGTVRGAAFVYLGSATGIQGVDDPALANARIISNEIDSFLGYSVSDAGDVNGDGFADIIVGGPRAGIPFPPNIPPYDRQGNGGVALVFLGSANGITGTGFADAHKELRPYPPGLPEINGGGMGASVSGAGDVNADGFADVIVSAPGWSDGTGVGAAVVFLGSASGIVGTDPASAHARIFSDLTTPMNGEVAAAGDVNGDGFGDIILGATGYPIPEPGFSPENRGAFLVFHGSSGGITATSAGDAQTFVPGNFRTQLLGYRVAAAGDIDNDGFGDIIAGAMNFPGSLNTEGAAYVFRGSTQGIVASSLSDDAYVRLRTQQSGAVLNLVDIAFNCSAAGDVNGDGFDDLIIGAGFYDAGEQNEGAAFIFHGGPAPINPNQPPVAVAGADQVYLDIDNDFSATITIDGSASFDLDGAIVSYEWFEGETLLGTSSVLTTALPATGDHSLVLVVTDDAGISRGDPVTVRVEAPGTPRISFDDFSSGGFAGGSGWAGSWAIAGDVSLSSVDTFPIPPHAFVGAGATLSRPVNLPGSTGISVKFQGMASQFATLDEVFVQVSVDGAPFTTIHTIDSSQSNDNFVTYGTTLPAPPGLSTRITHSWFPATASNVVLRFASNTTTGILYVDDVSVSAWSVAAGTPPPLAIQLPVANAGADITLDDNDTDGFESVILDGTQSADADGSIVSHQWFEETASGTSLLGTGSTLGATFGHGSHILRLIVTDNEGGSSADSVVVTVNQVFPGNQPPVANAGPDQTIVDVDGNTLEVVTFDGSASTDDGSIVSYIWTKNGTPFNNVATFSLTQPIGVHTVELTVTDNLGATNTDTVVVTVVPSDPIPTIDSFFATTQTITAGEFTTLVWTLTGTVSATIDNGIGAIGLTGSRNVSPATTTTYTLIATGTGGTATASVTVTVIGAPPANQVPTANAGLDQSVEDSDGDGTQAVTLDGLVSSDPDGNIVSFEWREGTISLATGINPLVSLAIGSHSIDLTVTDDAGASATDTVIVTVDPQPPTNQVPTANAGPDQTMIDLEGNGTEAVTLDGLASSDPDGSIVSFEWREGATMLASGVNPTMALGVGTHSIELTVTDDASASAIDTVVVSVSALPSGGSDFRTQLVKMTIPAGANSVVSSAFAAVDSSATVALISGVTQHAMGWTAETNQNPVDTSAFVALHASGSSLTASRTSAINQSDTVWVLLIEYIGSVGGNNEFIVQDRRVHSWTAGQSSTSYGPFSAAIDTNKVVVFGAGSSSANASSSGYDRGDVRAWMDGANNVQLVRGDGASAISSSHQMVEFSGSNWTIQSGDSAPSPDPLGSDIAINSVGNVSNAWVYFSWSTNSANLDERGHRLWLTSASILHLQEDAAATASKTIRWFVISNPEMQVQSGAADNLLNTANGGTIGGFAAVADPAQSFAWVTGMTDGGGNAHPRDMWQFELQDASTINLQRGRTGQELSYRYFVVELPTDGTNGGGGNQSPVANAGADQSVIDGNGDTLESILLDASASSDADGNIASYEWREGATLMATGVNPIISLAVGIHTIGMTVTDDGGATAVDTVVVTIDAQTPPPNQAPTANAGADQTLVDSDGNGSETVTLNGSASTDSDGTIVSYQWREGATPIASGVNPQVTLALGAHSIELTLTDNAGATAVDTVVVTIDAQTPPPNQAPTANAGGSQTLVDSDGSGSETVTLDGSASADSDGSIASYEWREAGTLIASGVNPQATLGLGAHTIQLTVTDNTGATAADTVVVTVDAAGAPPQGTVAISGPATIDRGDRTNFTVTFTNTGSATIAGVQLSFSFAPNSLLKNVTPASSVVVGDLAAGASGSQTWNVRGDNEGSGTVTGSASSGSTTLDTANQSLTVIK